MSDGELRLAILVMEENWRIAISIFRDGRMNIITCSEMENAGVSGAQTRRIDFELQFELFVKMVDIEDFVIWSDGEFFIFCINFPSI